MEIHYLKNWIHFTPLTVVSRGSQNTHNNTGHSYL